MNVFVHIMKLPTLLCNWILHFKTFMMDSCSLPSQISHHVLFLPVSLWPSGMEHSKCLIHIERKMKGRAGSGWRGGSACSVWEGPMLRLRWRLSGLLSKWLPMPLCLGLSCPCRALHILSEIPGTPPSCFTLLWTLHPLCHMDTPCCQLSIPGALTVCQALF